MKTICFDCQRTLDGKKIVNTCPKCGWPLIWDKKIMNYVQNLPNKYWIKINDYFGQTEVKKLSNNLRIKLEWWNPTWSFKDRWTLYEILFAKDNGYDEVICASTGNMAVSVGYFCQKMGVRWTISIPASTPPNRIDALKKYNIFLELIDDNYDVCAEMAKERAEQKKTLLVGDYFIRRFGQQSCGKEIAEQEIKFDYIFCPVGNGTFFNGVIEWFQDSNSEWKEQTKFVAVQWKWCDPLYQAWENRKQRIQTTSPDTIWAYFKVGNPWEWNIVMDYIYQNDYLIDSVCDDQMKKSKSYLFDKFNISTNYTSASVLASYQQLLKQWQISPNNKVLLILTGK